VEREEYAEWAAQMGFDVYEGPCERSVGGITLVLDKATWWVEIATD
jgi:hypothetical protein